MHVVPRIAMLRTALITVAAIVLASMGVLAFDRGAAPSSLLGSVLGGIGPFSTGPCPRGMVRVEFSGGPFCIDQFEASVGEGCPLRRPSLMQDTAINLSTPGCVPQSVRGREPWTYVSQLQAREACAKAGKRLPTPEEWFAAALGTPEEACVVKEQGGTKKTGKAASCTSSFEAQDMVGNVWEWVDAVVRGGVYGGVTLPRSGYVAEANEKGIPLSSLPRKEGDAYGGDRVWTDRTKVAGVMRGGFYRSGDAAGIYAFHAASPPTFVGDAIGFRCVRAVE